MLHRKWITRSISLLLCLLMAVPTVAAEAVAHNLNTNRKVLDVQLREKGSILGKLIDRQGNSLPNVAVKIQNKQGATAKVLTNRDGIFVAQGLTTGELMIEVGQQNQIVRVWDARLAPPSAAPAAMFVVGDTVRGQLGAGGGLMGGLMANPWMLAGVGIGVAAGVAAAVDAADDDDAS